jgi:hypothetical protein
LIPKLYKIYKSYRNPSTTTNTTNTTHTTPKPLPPKTAFALTILFLSALLALLSTLPITFPENIFLLTQSRLHTPASVLLTRLSALRPLTPTDEHLRQILDRGAFPARIYYTLYGPTILTENPLSQPGDLDAERDLLLYALPALALPHLAHLLALGLATSPLWSGPPGARWRSLATTLGLAAAVAEIYYVAMYDATANVRSTRVAEVDFAFWRIRVWRGVGLAAADALLGWVIWLQATGRGLRPARTGKERVGDALVAFERVLGKVRGLGIVRNGEVREAGLRRVVDEYWVREGEVMKDVMEQKVVVEAQRRALGRIDMVRVQREAVQFVDGFLVDAVKDIGVGGG